MNLNVFVLMCLLFSLPAVAEFPGVKAKKLKTVDELVDNIHKRIDKFAWDKSLFPKEGWQFKGHSVDGYPLIYWTCGKKSKNNTSLILSAVHGDEITPVYFGFRLVEWLKARPQICEDKFVVVAPLVNPDGFFRYRRGTRSNYNKVDLNRNFATPDWDEHALRLWKERYKSRRRYYPGKIAESEPETLFQKWLINNFNVSKIMSIHAPLNILDFDGPKSEPHKELKKAYINSCEALKARVQKATPKLKLFTFGTFPGSLGNYAGTMLGIPTITVELPTTNYRKAGEYFGELEKGTQLFVDFALEEKSFVAKSDQPDVKPAN